MFKQRLIPKLQMKQSSFGNRMVLVTTLNFDDEIEIGDPVSQAKIYEAQAADELIFVDIHASQESREAIVDVLRQAVEQIFMPITVGGGIRSIEGFRRMLNSGADKVSINTAAVETPNLITEASDIFGAQCVVLSIDFRRDADGKARVWTNSGRDETGLDPVVWAQQGVERGAGEILLTSIDRDGTRQGLDLEITQAVSEAVSVPVISSGGCGLAQHFVDGFKIGKADAISAGTYFCFKDENPMQCRAQIKNAGIQIRTHQ